MDVDENCPLLLPQSEGHEPYPQSNDSRKPGSSPSKSLSITVALFGVFLASADEQLVMATYGPIASEFENLSDGSWLLTGYNLGYCIALPLYGKISDYYGCKKPLLAAYCLFGVGCIISGTALSLWQAIVGRVISGVGGSGMVALISVMITDIVSLDQVAVLKSYTSVANIGGRSAGGPLGGLLADTIGWRWSFLGQAPMALICLILAGWQLPSESANREDIESHSDNKHHTSVGSERLRDEDFLGGILFTITITIFLLILALGGHRLSWTDPIILSLVATCVISSTVFGMMEGFWARKPLIPLRLMRKHGIDVFCMVQILLFCARLAFLSNMVPYFVRTENASNTYAAAYLAPSTLSNAFGALLAGFIIGRTYRYKTLSLVSLAIGSLSYVLIALRWRHGTNFWESFYTVPAGLGFGMILSTQFIGLLANTPKRQTVTAVSTYYLSQQVGAVIGVAAAAAILRVDFRRTLLRQLENYPERDWIVEGVLSNSRFAQSLSLTVQSIVRSSYLHSFQYIPILGICGSIMVLPLILLIREQPLIV